MTLADVRRQTQLGRGGILCFRTHLGSMLRPAETDTSLALRSSCGRWFLLYEAHQHSRIRGFADANTLFWSESLIPSPPKTLYTPQRLIALSDGKDHKY
jgi:hypothetical protein